MAKEVVKSSSLEGKNRIDFVSWIQFIGVMSVIFGHSMNSIAVPQIWVDIKAWVYTWHMPLFFLISAFLFSYKGGFEKGYKRVFSNRFMRLLVPYIVWNAIFIVPKIIFAPYINDQVVLDMNYFVRILLRPRDNILGHTWFLAALFEMFVIAIFFEKIRKNKKLWIPVACVLIVTYCFGVLNRYFAVGDLMKNGIFFWVGLILGGVGPQKIQEWLKDRGLFVALVLILVGSTIVWAYNPDMKINTLLVGMTSLVLFAALQINMNINFRYMDFVSRNAFPIYILHWPVMMVIRLIVYTKLKMAPSLTMIIMLVGGVVIPSFMTWILTKFKSKFMKIVCRLVFGM